MLKVIELFAGIGAWSKALKNLEIDFEVVDAVEIDKFAIQSYNAIHNTNFETQDICKWNKDIEDIDILCHSSPCTDISVAGRNEGADENSGTRSSLMYESLRIIEKIKPKYVLWENVKNLLSKKHKHNFEKYLVRMNIMGYNSYYKVLEANDYGVPQQRERIFVVSIRKDIDNHNFKFPSKRITNCKLKDLLEPNEQIDKKLYLDNNLTKYYIPKRDKKINTGLLGKYESNPKIIIKGNLKMKQWLDHMKRIYDINGCSPTLTTMGGGNAEPKILISENPLIIRMLSPLECWRLMGFSDEDYYKCKKLGISQGNLYKQAGNSIVVNVIMNIFKELLKIER